MPTGDGPQPREQLLDVERLGDVVVGAGVERRDLLPGVEPAGEHEDRDRRPAAQRADDVDAVEVGQPEVQHDDVGMGCAATAASPPRPSAADATS